MIRGGHIIGLLALGLHWACIGLAFGGEYLVVFQSRNRIRFGNASANSSFFRKIVILRIPGFLFFKGEKS